MSLPVTSRAARAAAAASRVAPPPASVLMMERHFTILELAEMWNFSKDFIHERFRDEPGVVHTRRRGTRTKRGYGAIRIPQGIAERVYAAMMVGA